MHLLFTIFEDLEIQTLNQEEAAECLYYVNCLLDQEESPESFIKYNLLKIKILGKLKELQIKDL